MATPECVGLLWGPGMGQAVERVKLPYKGNAHGGYIRWFLCPICGRKTPRLYLPPEGDGFACRKCLALAYRAWKESGKVRQPRKPEGWFKWFSRQAAKVLAKGGNSE
ncbi:hypothetical protein SDD30_14905 [Moorella naiadis]|uniref:hypothetical protein n=1 Tax=Moorella naiadis (nom. illeg.) TaxID=3093670 RepID=UPI003D9CB069